jgi:DtxR family Mn-dependent transcriptional regulator
MISAAVEHYLKAIYELGGKEQPVSLSALARELSISQVSTNEMVKKLTEREMVTYKPYRGVTLTPAGRARALAVTRRHRLWERFLTDFLGLSWDQVHQEACSLEHATSPLVEERLAQFLGWPETCPHGHPVPDPKGEIALIATQPLATLEPGQVGIVHSVQEEPELLQYLDNLGLVLQVEVQVEAVAPFEGPVTVRVGDAQHIIGWKVASQVQVCLR